MQYIGIDISKSTFTAAFPLEQGFRVLNFENSTKGIRSFISHLDADTNQCVMEATGNYCMLLLYILNEQSYRVSLINARQIKHFARMLMTTTKTDKEDAKMISLYGSRMTPEVYKMPSKMILLLKQKRVVIRQLKKQVSALKNIKESFSVLPLHDKVSNKTVDKSISFLQSQIDDMQDDLTKDTLKEYDGMFKRLISIKGIGIVLATAILVTTGAFEHFENAKQVSRYIGICPTQQQSGVSLNIRGHINRNGDSHLRGLLYVASWSAIRYNKQCREFYDGLKKRGKPSKVALIAVSNKLIRQAFAVCKSDSMYDPDYISSYIVR